ncbi:MAG: hypothetical protein JO073_00355 [Actinobacteria bacterium]|nr:hypothetical protein [Actinomycetota bacterium]
MPTELQNTEPPTLRAERERLRPANLLLDLAELEELLDAELAREEDALDAFLLAAGIQQVLEDWLQRDVLHVRALAGRAPGRAEALLRAGDAALVRARPQAEAGRLAAKHAAFVDELAARVMADGGVEGLRRPGHGRLPEALLRSVQRLPNCFQSFDQKPEDCAALAERFAALRPDRAAPLVVAGLRTSGNYLAPLVAASLRALGFEDVEVATHRPETPVSPRLRSLLRGRAILLVDDPPRTGASLAAAARELEAAGASASDVVLLLPLLGEGVPEPLEPWPRVVLPFDDWAIQRRLHVPVEPERGHVRIDLGDGTLLEGVGLGYFGRHALTVAETIGARPVSFEDGLIRYVPRADTDPLEIALRRRDSLGLPDDPSLRLIRRDATWETGATLIELCFGKTRPIARPAVRRAARRILTSARPCTIDGGIDSIVGSAFTASGYSLAGFDPVFDLAATGDRSLRRAWREATGERVSAERWFLYELLHATAVRERCRETGDVHGSLDAERAAARAMQGYMRETYALGQTRGNGPLCAIDCDGVLETLWSGIPVLGPDGALALRALQRHGFRPVLVTGRSLGEVRKRCEAYGLPGGVAEYGGAMVAGATETVLLGEEHRDRIDDARRRLAARAGVVADPAFRHSIRAYRFDRDGSHGGVSQADVDSLAGSGLRTWPGAGQTDFQVAYVDKGTGVDALADALGGEVAFAIGDGAADLPLLRKARRAFAPAGCDPALRTVARELPYPFQAGLLEAVQAFLGHDPRRCPVCEPPAPSRDAWLLATALRAKDASRAQKLASAVAVALRRGR